MPATNTKQKVDARLLVDEFAKVRKEKAAAEKHYNALRNQILALGRNVCNGTNGTKAIVLSKSRQSLDTKGLKEEYGDDWYNGWCIPIHFQEIEIVEG